MYLSYIDLSDPMLSVTHYHLDIAVYISNSEPLPTAETLFEYSMLDNVRSVQLSSLYESVIPKQKIIVLKAKLTNRYICINSRGDVVSYVSTRII